MYSNKENIDWDDIVFENRNKEYGAYPIRKGYKKRYAWSLFVAIALLLIVVWILDHKTKDYLPVPPKSVRTVNVHIKEYQLPKPPIKKKEPLKPTASKQKETIRSSTNKIDKIPIIVNTIIEKKDLTITPVVLDKAIEPIEGPKIAIRPIIQAEPVRDIHATQPAEDITEKQASTRVQSLPHYPGGDSAWYQYLRKNLNMQTVLRNGAMPSVYTAVVAFIVHSDSTTSDFKIVKDPGYGAGAEALRVVQKSGKWIPGAKNGKPVNFAQLQTVIFKVNN